MLILLSCTDRCCSMWWNSRVDNATRGSHLIQTCNPSLSWQLWEHGKNGQDGCPEMFPLTVMTLKWCRWCIFFLSFFSTFLSVFPAEQFTGGAVNTYRIHWRGSWHRQDLCRARRSPRGPYRSSAGSDISKRHLKTKKKRRRRRRKTSCSTVVASHAGFVVFSVH